MDVVSQHQFTIESEVTVNGVTLFLIHALLTHVGQKEKVRISIPREIPLRNPESPC